MIDFGPLVYEFLLPFLAVVLTALVGIGIRYLGKKIGIEEESQLAEALQGAAERAVLLGLDRVAQSGRPLTVEVKHEILATAATYLLDRVPEATRHFGLSDPRRIEDFLEARLLAHLDLAPNEPH